MKLARFAVLFAAVLLQACSKDHEDTFINCPNGVINPFEECDDGNLNERDNCLTSCKLPFCGDTVAHVDGTPTEQCDFPDFDGVTCNSLGLAGGEFDLSCTSNCLFDTSTCGPPLTPTPEPTATGTTTPTATPTHTPTSTATHVPGVPTATATATPTETPSECSPIEAPLVAYTVSYSAPSGQPVSVIQVIVGYPANALFLPETNTRSRVTPAFQPGSFVVAPPGPQGLTVTLGRSPELPNLPAGPLMTVNFNSCVGVEPPPPEALTCTVPEEGCASAFGPVAGCECQVTSRTP